MTSISIPNTVVHIGDNAFYGCQESENSSTLEDMESSSDDFSDYDIDDTN